MKSYFLIPLNIFFFLLYTIAGRKILMAFAVVDILDLGDSLSWGEFFNVILFFSSVVFFSMASSYAILVKSPEKKIKKGIIEDDESPEVTPDIVIDGKEETPESLIDIIEDKSGKVFTQPPKVKKKKKKI